MPPGACPKIEHLKGACQWLRACRVSRACHHQEGLPTPCHHQAGVGFGLPAPAIIKRACQWLRGVGLACQPPATTKRACQRLHGLPSSQGPANIDTACPSAQGLPISTRPANAYGGWLGLPYCTGPATTDTACHIAKGLRRFCYYAGLLLLKRTKFPSSGLSGA